MKHDSIELIIVFKKDIKTRVAQKILDRTGVPYREGMDSSKGKIYFYNTGPKFILTFGTEQDKNEFITAYQHPEEVYEIYTPDWTRRKD